MIIKSSNFLYLFDFDGTVVGSDSWLGFIENTKMIFRQQHLNPSDYDIRWCLLTSRPRIDYLLIKSVCLYHGMSPKQIFTSPTWTYNFKSKIEEADCKSQFIKDILDEKIKINYTDSKIDKICYIDNNSEITRQMNNRKDGYSFVAISVPDFLTKNLEIILM